MLTLQNEKPFPENTVLVFHPLGALADGSGNDLSMSGMKTLYGAFPMLMGSFVLFFLSLSAEEKKDGGERCVVSLDSIRRMRIR